MSVLSDIGAYVYPHLAAIDGSAAEARRAAVAFLSTGSTPNLTSWRRP
jgi:hypothetical protein